MIHETGPYKAIGKFIIKGNIINIDEPTNEEESQEQKYQRRRLAYAMKMRDQEVERELQRREANMCPICHMLIPTSGICDCGYNKYEQHDTPITKTQRKLRILHI